MRSPLLALVVFVLGSLLVVAACKKTNDAIPDAGTLLKSTAAPSTGIVPPVAKVQVIAPGESIVIAWNAALDGHDAHALESLYASSVKLYGKEMTRAQAVAAKKKALDADRSFRQIVTGITIEEGSRARASFTKIVTASGSTKSYAAYLVLVNHDSKIEIAEESDQTTDANLKPADEDRCLAAAASAAIAAGAISKSLSEPITPDLADAGCTNHGFMPMPREKGEPFVAIRLHTSCTDRAAFRGWYYVSVADGCVYEDRDFSGDATKYTKLECTKGASAVKNACASR
jgi:hypothetical protein